VVPGFDEEVVESGYRMERWASERERLVVKPTNTIEDTCTRYIKAVLGAKERSATSDDFWKDRKAQRAYERVCDAISAQVPDDLRWWDLAGSTSEQIWQGDFDPATGTERFVKRVKAHLAALERYDWIACLPLEHVFCRFPAFTDFGDFLLVNPKQKQDEVGIDELLKQFRAVLTDKLHVNFAEPIDPNNESYLRLGDHYFNKSGGYIPGRPQMVVKVGRGDTFVNKLILSGIASYNLALLAVCQIEYELHSGLLETRVISPGHDCLPNGKPMQRGMIEIPPVAVAINVNSGQADWWGMDARNYETQEGIGYDPDKLMEIWNQIATPLLRLRGAGLSDRIRVALDNAIRFVARCRHAAMGDLTLHSVIATETILNPFNARGDTLERFAIFAAALTGRTLEKRLETYYTARQLYNLRNTVVHQSALHVGKAANDSRKKAFGLFLACLKSIVAWAATKLANGGKCGEAEFRELFTQTVLSPI
jgi:hypothetical protein